MQRIQVWAELSDEHYRAYEAEAERRAMTVEALVEQTVNCLIRELEDEQRNSAPDRKIIVS